MVIRVVSHVLAASVLLALSACGGGGGGDLDNAGGVSSSVAAYNEVTVTKSALIAGESISMKASTTMRMTTPKSMIWSVVPISTPNPNTDPAPIISDPECNLASYSTAVSTTTPGEGVCTVILTVPSSAKTGTWRVGNTAADGGIVMASKFVDISITALPYTGFRLLESSVPISGYPNQLVNLNIPFTADPGVIVTNPIYQWTPGSQNPTNDPILGANNARATVSPSTSGQYQYKLTVTADVNGRRQEASGSVVILIKSGLWPDLISAGDVQIITVGGVARLTGAILNKDAKFVYATGWKQLSGSLGGPVAVTLANADSDIASFVSTLPGTYGFEFTVTKIQSNGTPLVTRAQTAIIVEPAKTI